MRSPLKFLLIVLASVALGACRQADGPIPEPDADVQAELVDVAKDLQNVARGTDPEAQRDLTSDLGKYARRPAEVPAVDELSRLTAAAVRGVDLSERSAQRLAQSLWVAVSARELSERQVENLRNDMQLLLTSIGVSESNAQQVAAQVTQVQGAVNSRPRRWYEVF